MEWKTVKLGDILSISGGQLYKGDLLGKGNNLLLGMGCVSFTDKFLMKGARQYAGDCLPKNEGHPGDIVLATRQQSDNLPILAMPAMIPDGLKADKVVIGSNLYKVNITDSEFDNRFIFWLLKTPDYVNYIASVKTGTTVKMITIKDVENYTFACPPKAVRDKISSLIWDLDAKIDNNNRINANLEAQAQALYKSWFIDFEPFGGSMPDDWKERKLGEIISELPKSKIQVGHAKDQKGEYPFFTSGTSIYEYPTALVDGANIYMNTGGNAGIEFFIGKAAYSTDTWCINGGDLYTYFLHRYLLSIFTLLNTQYFEGSALKHLKKQALKDRVIYIPSDKILTEFNRLTHPLYQIITENIKENTRLATLRDTLLPKLMKGEIEL